MMSLLDSWYSGPAGLLCAVVPGVGAAEGVVAAGESATARETAKSFFDGTRYSRKVLQQMEGGVGEFHSFPEAVKTFESTGITRNISGGDGVVREMLEIPGSYGSREGVFQFIKEADGTINHRLFVSKAR